MMPEYQIAGTGQPFVDVALAHRHQSAAYRAAANRGGASGSKGRTCFILKATSPLSSNIVTVVKNSRGVYRD